MSTRMMFGGDGKFSPSALVERDSLALCRVAFYECLTFVFLSCAASARNHFHPHRLGGSECDSGLLLSTVNIATN